MARGRKYNDDIKEKAYALLATNNSMSYVAEKLNIPRSTVKTWKEQYDKDARERGEDDIAKVRHKNKERFVAKAWDIIDKAQVILERRLDRAIKSEDELDELADEICKLDYKQLNDIQRKALYSRLMAIKIENIKDLTMALGTLYDKQALANKEATAIIDNKDNIRISFVDKSSKNAGAESDPKIIGEYTPPLYTEG